MRFVLALHSDDGVRFGVIVPDLPGCYSAGDTLDEAIASAREAIAGHCEILAEDGADIPVPRLLAVHQADPELVDAVWVVVDVPVERYFGPAEKINITVQARLLRRIDAFAADLGESRSGFLARAAQDLMARTGSSEASVSLHRGIRVKPNAKKAAKKGLKKRDSPAPKGKPARTRATAY